MFAQLIETWSEDWIRIGIAALPRQAALVVGIALLLRCLPRLAASWRHWIWLAAGLAVGVIPIAATLLPDWRVIPVEWLHGSGVPRAMTDQTGALLGGETPGWATDGPLPAFGWVEFAFFVWLAGAAILLARLAGGILGLRAFQKRRWPTGHGRLCARLERCRRLVHMPVLVDLYLSSRSTLPMTWGVRRPAINVPEEAEGWSDERLDAVFLHELAHIQRADCWTNMLLKVICALNWFNPLVWVAARRTYLAQEVACDDFACERLRASDYARHLLELTAVVRDFPRRTIEPAVGLSSCDHLRFRVAAALDPRRSRRPLPGRAASLMSTVIFMLMGVLAMTSLRFVEESRATFAPTGPAGWSGGERTALEGPESRDLPGAFSFESDLNRMTTEGTAPGSEAGANAPAPGPSPLWVGPERDLDTAASGRQQGPLREGSSPTPGPAGNERETGPVSESPAFFQIPPVVPAKVVASPPSPPPSPRPLGQGLLSFQEDEIDWKGFQRRGGEPRRGRSVLLSPAESVVQRYARLSEADRDRAGGVQEYLSRSGLRLSDAALRDLIHGMRRHHHLE